MRVIAIIFCLLIGCSYHALTQEENSTNSQLQKDLDDLNLKLQESEALLDDMEELRGVYDEINEALASIQFETSEGLITQFESLSSPLRSSGSLTSINDNTFNELEGTLFGMYKDLQELHDEFKKYSTNAGQLELSKYSRGKLQELFDTIDSQIEETVNSPGNELFSGFVLGLGLQESDLIDFLNSDSTIEQTANGYFEVIKGIYSQGLMNASSALEFNREAQEELINETKASIQSVLGLIDKSTNWQSKIDQTLIWTLPIYGFLMAAMLAIPRLYKGNDKLQINIFDSGLILELITVYLLTATILILGIASKIQSEVLGTLIGGISGYVLGRSGKQENEQKEKKAVETE